MGISRIYPFIVFLGGVLLVSSALQGAVPEIEWSHQRGLVAEPFQLSLTSEPEASIFYTTDGSAPSPESAIYSEPLQIDKTTILRAIAIANGETTSVETHSFLFIDQVANQEATPEGFPMQIVSGRNGPDRPHTFDWAMDPEVLDDVANNGDIVEHLQDIPTLSVVMELKDLNFLFENQTRRGVDYERATSLELIYPNKEACAEFGGFQIDCGARMQGGGAGDQARKKSLRILFKKDYGKGSLKYPLFESAVHFGGNGESSFDGIVLRAGGNTNWSKDDAWKHEPSTYLRDPFVRDSQIAISGMGSRSVFVHLYINGLYFGLYNIAERPDEKFISSYMGGDVEDFYAINHGGTVNGDASYWDDTVSSSSLRNLDQPDRYENIRERIDVEAYCDYVLLNWLVGMGDWPHNNFYAGVRHDPPGKIRYFAWDSEYAFWTLEGYLGSNPTAWVHPAFDSDRNTLPEIWLALSENEDFLMTFADRVYRHCFNDGALTDANCRARFQRLADHIENAIVAESARWGDSSWGKEDQPHTRANDFIPNRDAVLDLMEGNVAIFIDVLRQRGFYPDLEPPVISSIETMLEPDSEITMENPNRDGSIYYTVDGSDPRLSGGGPSPTAVEYDANAPILITEATRLKARVIDKDTGTSSPLYEKLYLTSPVGFPLRITEVMYHPQENKALEFVEFMNVSLANLDLTGFYVKGIDYRFPPGTCLVPDQIVVLIPNDDPAAFREAYPEVDFFGTYRRHLANDGEEIQILNANDQRITSITFDDDQESAWPGLSDGLGHSLEVLDPITAAVQSSDWIASSDPGGTPGVFVKREGPGDPIIPPMLRIERLDATTVRLHFEAQPDIAYDIEAIGNLQTDSWQTVTSFPTEEVLSIRVLEDTISSDEEYYRLRIP